MGRRRLAAAFALLVLALGAPGAAEDRDRPPGDGPPERWRASRAQRAEGERRPEGGRAQRAEGEGSPEGGPAPRAELRRLRHRLWEATRDDREALRRDLGDPDPGALRALHERVRALPPPERRALRERVARYRSLAPAEQQALRDRLSALRDLDAGERARIRDNARRFRDLAPAERERLRAAWRRLRDMPSEEREALLERLEQGPASRAASKAAKRPRSEAKPSEAWAPGQD